MTGKMPERTLWTGIIVTAGGALLLLLGQDLLGTVVTNEPSSLALLQVWGYASTTIRLIAVPLGSALIGAGLVMRYLRGLLEARAEQTERG